MRASLPQHYRRWLATALAGWACCALQRNAFSAFRAACFDQSVLKRHALSCPLMCVNAPGPIRHVLQTHADDYARLSVGRRVLSPIVGRGLLVSEG